MNLKPLHDRVQSKELALKIRQKAVSLFLIRSRKTYGRQGPSCRKGVTENGQVVALDVKKATKFYLVNGLVLKLRLMVKSFI